MPNHVKTIITIESFHNTNAVIDAITKIEDGKRVVDFNTLIPMPDYIYHGDLGREEMKKYGKNNWYNWSICNWGTKWNAYDCEFYDDTVEFCTAWAAPEPIYRALGKKFPEYKFIIQFADEDLGSNCGEFIIQNTKVSYISMDMRDVGNKKALEFACKVWGETPEEHGYKLKNGEYVYAEEDDE